MLFGVGGLTVSLNIQVIFMGIMEIHEQDVHP